VFPYLVEIRVDDDRERSDLCALFYDDAAVCRDRDAVTDADFILNAKRSCRRRDQMRDGGRRLNADSAADRNKSEIVNVGGAIKRYSISNLVALPERETGPERLA
jgi:hypothetical protein